MKKGDLEYLCTNLGNLTGIPIRLYHKNSLVFYYSIVKLSKDPFENYKDNAFKANRNVEYFISPFFDYYGIVSFGNRKIVIGPTREVELSEQKLKRLAFETGVPHYEIEDFISAIKSINKLPLLNIVQILCTVNFVLSGEKLSLEKLAILDIEQNSLKDKLETEEAVRTIEIANETKVQTPVHNTLALEQMLIDIVRKGDVTALKDFIAKAPAVKSGIVAKDYLRQAKNTFIVTATLVSRAAIHGGMDTEDALSLSDSYIQKCEMSTSSENITNLQYRMILDYTERVEKIKIGNTPSKLVSQVANYVRHHLSDAITTDDIAKSLFMSRSRLSTEFKKQTGEGVYEFVIRQKIDEAKRLLRYSDKHAADIAFYLGFSSQSHFIRVFKKYVFLTPNEYRTKR